MSRRNIELSAKQHKLYEAEKGLMRVKQELPDKMTLATWSGT